MRLLVCSSNDPTVTLSAFAGLTSVVGLGSCDPVSSQPMCSREIPDGSKIRVSHVPRYAGWPVRASPQIGHGVSDASTDPSGFTRGTRSLFSWGRPHSVGDRMGSSLGGTKAYEERRVNGWWWPAFPAAPF